MDRRRSGAGCARRAVACALVAALPGGRSPPAAACGVRRGDSASHVPRHRPQRAVAAGGPAGARSAVARHRRHPLFRDPDRRRRRGDRCRRAARPGRPPCRRDRAHRHRPVGARRRHHRHRHCPGRAGFGLVAPRRAFLRRHQRLHLRRRAAGRPAGPLHRHAGPDRRQRGGTAGAAAAGAAFGASDRKRAGARAALRTAVAVQLAGVPGAGRGRRWRRPAVRRCRRPDRRRQRRGARAACVARAGAWRAVAMRRPVRSGDADAVRRRAAPPGRDRSAVVVRPALAPAGLAHRPRRRRNADGRPGPAARCGSGVDTPGGRPLARQRGRGDARWASAAPRSIGSWRAASAERCPGSAAAVRDVLRRLSPA